MTTTIMAVTDANAEIQGWLDQRRFSHEDFTIPQLAAIVQEKKLNITVIIPGKEVASTIAGVIKQTVEPLVQAKVVSSVVVIDAASKDGTGKVAALCGARVVQRADIASEYGASRGKGDALWRALLVTEGDIVAFLDGDTGDPSPAHLIGIIGPLLANDSIQMVRACFDRPFKTASGHSQAHDGGRVTECLARPLLNTHWPSLAGFRQPLAGEFAARRSLLERLPFPVGYGIEIGTLVDTYNMFGLNALAEADVGQRQNAHKPLRELTTMAMAINNAVERRLSRGKHGVTRMFLPWENGYREVDNTERPPMQEYRRHRLEMETPPRSPHIDHLASVFMDVEGVRMFRDIGGYVTTTSKHVKSGLLYRSGEPSNLTSTGKEALLMLGIKKIFDFRSPIEINDGEVFAKFILETDVERIAAPVFRDEDWLPEKREARLQHYASASEGYAKAYKHTLEQGAHAFKPIFEHLAQTSPTPILFHCTAGKDRTGVASMLILLLAGCDATIISKEYALNNLESDKEWSESATNRLLTQPGLCGNIDAVANVVQAREEFMLATIDMFEKEFGGISSYMRDYLGFDDEVLATIRQHIVV